MEYQPYPPERGQHSQNFQYTQNNFPPNNNVSWNNNQRNEMGMKQNNNMFSAPNISTTHWNNSNCSLDSHVPPTPTHNFSHPPPPPFIGSRPPPPLHANNGHIQPPQLNINNVPPPPVNFNQSTPPFDANFNRLPPPLYNPHQNQYRLPPHQQRFQPDIHGIGFSQTQPSCTPSRFPTSEIPPQPQSSYTNNLNHHNSEQKSLLSVSHKSHLNNSYNENVNTSNLPTHQEQFESEIEKKRKTGQQRLASWLYKIGKVKKGMGGAGSTEKQAKKKIRMNKYLCKLQSCMALISDMSRQVEKLDSTMSDADKSFWQTECDVMEKLKAKHKNLKSAVDNGHVEQVEKKLFKIRQRKSRLKRSRHHKFEQRQEMEDTRQTKDKEISDWQQRLLSEMKEELEKKKKKQEMDQTLSEVTKKISDANRLIETMTSLEKLRLIRQDAAQKRGDSDLGESRQSFEQKISDMTRLVRSQLEVYKEEEQQLRRMIKSEQEETNKKEKELQEIKDKEEQRQKEEELRKKLFGFSDDADVSDPLFPYQQYYKQAETSLPAFVHIRHEWDQYLVPAGTPGGSTIPTGWVLPSHPSSSAWASALL